MATMMTTTVTAHVRRTFLTACPPAILLALALTGCGGGSNSSSPASQSVTTATPLSVSAPTPSGLTATFAENAAAVPVGGSVTYTLTPTNNTTQPITFRPVSDPNIGTNVVNTLGGSINIINASGNSFPSGGNTGATPIGIGSATTVAPGQSVSGTYATGNIFTSAGRYTAMATFATLPTLTASPQTTTVGPLTVTAQ